jgi:hypothetical protein
VVFSARENRRAAVYTGRILKGENAGLPAGQRRPFAASA